MISLRTIHVLRRGKYTYMMGNYKKQKKKARYKEKYLQKIDNADKEGS